MRLLGGRGSRLEGHPPRLARAGCAGRDPPAPPAAAANPFLADLEGAAANPFAPPGTGGGSFNPFLADDDADADNPFAPRRAARPAVGGDALPKLRLLGRGLGVAGSYAKVLLAR